METLTFRMHFCCANCLKQYAKAVVVPRGEGMPYDVESFLESAAAQSVQFTCALCEGNIGTLRAVTLDDAAHGQASSERDDRRIEPTYESDDLDLRAVVSC